MTSVFLEKRLSPWELVTNTDTSPINGASVTADPSATESHPTNSSDTNVSSTPHEVNEVGQDWGTEMFSPVTHGTQLRGGRKAAIPASLWNTRPPANPKEEASPKRPTYEKEGKKQGCSRP